jgi:hypothetical protein
MYNQDKLIKFKAIANHFRYWALVENMFADIKSTSQPKDLA